MLQVQMDRYNCCVQVVLGYQYTMAIDMWSLGCVAAELFLGLPLFPGASEHDLLSRITEMLGPPPPGVLASSKNAEKYFTVVDSVVQTPQGAPPQSLPARASRQLTAPGPGVLRRPALLCTPQPHVKSH